MDIFELLISAAITGLSAAIGGYVMMKFAMRNIKNQAEAWLNSPKGHEAIYSVGVLLGNAIMSGAGFQKPTKTKGGLEALIMQGIGAFIQSKIPGLGAQQNAYEQPAQ